MRKKKGILQTMVVAICLISMAALCAWSASGEKIPITTSSKEALQLFLKGRDLQDRLQVQESLAPLQKAVEKDPNFALAYMFLSFAQPTFKGFFEYLDKAVALVDNASDGEKLWILAQEAGAKGQPMKQLEYSQKLVQAYPNDERAHNLLAVYYFGQQEWKMALPEYKRATEINPEFSTAYNQLGYAYRFLGEYENAEKAFKRYIELIPKDPNPYDSYAELLMKMGRFDESIESYKKALEQNPNFVSSFIGIATDLDLKGEHSKARERLQKLCDIARSDAERRAALFSMAVSYVFEGKMDDALGKMREQYQIGAMSKDAGAMAADLNTMGNILIEMNKADDAKTKFEEALKLIENSDLSVGVKANARRQSIYNLGQAALKKGDLAAAKNYAAQFQEAAQAANNPLQAKLAHQLEGMIALEDKNFDAAVTELQQASFDFNPQNYYRLALAYQGKGDIAKAKEYFGKAANFNGLDGFTYAFVWAKAKKALGAA